jgi:arsenate reductase (thioredoxin)
LLLMTAHILILCTHNSARSVLAEAMLNHWARRLGRDVVAHSAGSTPKPGGRVNPFALQVLADAGIEMGPVRSKSWNEFAQPGAPKLTAVITVCDSAAQEQCPYFPGAPVQVHWGYPDPSDAPGGDDGKRRAFELTRQALGYRMLQLLALPIAQANAVDALDPAALRLALQAIAKT